MENSAPTGRIGSVFLDSHDLVATAAVLAALLPGVTTPAPDAEWHHVDGEVEVLLHRIPDDEELPGAGFGIRVVDVEKARAAVQATGHAECSELFDVDGTTRGFDVTGDSFKVLFVHD